MKNISTRPNTGLLRHRRRRRTRKRRRRDERESDGRNERHFTSWGWAGNFGELSFGFQASAARPSDKHKLKKRNRHSFWWAQIKKTKSSDSWQKVARDQGR